jgi:uncharacterized protein (TIGR03382 family)
MKFLAVATVGLTALAFAPTAAEACGPSLTCASQFCTSSAQAIAEGTVARLDVADNNQFSVTLENAEIAGSIQMTGTITVLADSFHFSSTDIGTSVLLYLIRDDATGDLVVQERHTRGAIAELDCFDPGVPVSEIADVVLAEDCFQTLPHDVGYCPENKPFGCSAGGAQGSLALFAVGLVLWRRRRR